MNEKVILNKEEYKSAMDRKIAMNLDLKKKKITSKSHIHELIGELKEIRRSIAQNNIEIKENRLNLRNDRLTLRRINKELRISKRDIRKLSRAFINQKSIKINYDGIDYDIADLSDELYQEILEGKTNNNIDLMTKKSFALDSIKEDSTSLSASLKERAKLSDEYTQTSGSLSEERLNYRINKYNLSKNNKDLNKINSSYIKGTKIKAKKLGNS